MRRPWAVLLLGLLAVRYGIWRVSSTLDLSNPLAAVLSLGMLLAEFLLLASTHLQLWFSLALPARPPTRSPADLPHGYLPSVAVLVPTYGEPAALIERCLRGCLAIDYPRKQVWLLDDSGRPELARLCAALGCRYLMREERNHAKAGNLNHGLRHCNSDLVAVFDADVVPLRTFLRRTVPYFQNSATGFVQTPQTYMNADPVMRNLQLERWLMPDEESFYRWIEPTRAALGAVVCAGTSFVMRRTALDRVGGFETDTASEDLATGIRITAAGFRNVYLDEKLSAGLAPLTAAAMARQRCRWASGSLQTLRTGASPLRIPGLTPLQRLAYLEGILHWFSVLAQLLLLLSPLSLGLLGIAPIRLSGEGVLTIVLPLYLSQMLLMRWLNGHSRSALLPELYRWIFLVPLCAAVLATLAGRPQRFRVTPKALSRDRRLGMDRRLLLPLVFLLSLQVLALTHLLQGRVPAAVAAFLVPVSPTTRVLALGWGALNTLLLLLAIRACRDREGGDGAPWFALTPSAVVQLVCSSSNPTPAGRVSPWQPAETQTASVAARLKAISEQGAEIVLPTDPFAQLLLPGDTVFVEGLIAASPLPLTIAAMGPARLGGHWGILGDEQRRQLEELLYRRPDLWPTLRAPFELPALPLVVRRLLQPVPAEDWFQRSLIQQRTPTPAPPLPPLRGTPSATASTATPGLPLQPSSRQASP
jgi:cellulose synthase (UDP-forming)